MLQFKPLVKDNMIKVMAGSVEIGRIARGNPGETVLTLTGKGSVTAADLLRVLGQMGVNGPKDPDKVETAAAAQRQVMARARALRLPPAKPRVKSGRGRKA